MKKDVQKMGCEEKGEKKTGSKKEEAAWLLFFLNSNDPVVFATCFLQPIFWTFFQGNKPTRVFKTKIVVAD